MLTDAFPSAIPNWMYAVQHLPEAGLPEGFETLAVPEKALLLSPQSARDHATQQ